MKTSRAERSRIVLAKAEQFRRKRRKGQVRVPRPNSLFSGVYRSIVRSIWDVGTGAAGDGSSASYAIDVGFVFPSGHSGLSTIFKSVRVHSMIARFFPAVAPIDQMGFTAMNFGDIDEVPSSSSVVQVLASPGNTVVQTGKVARCRWHPTEPSDTEFIDMVNSKGHTWARLNLALWPEKEKQWMTVGEVKNHLHGKIIADIDCTLRGQGAKLTSKHNENCPSCSMPSSIKKYPQRFTVINGLVGEAGADSDCTLNHMVCNRFDGQNAHDESAASSLGHADMMTSPSGEDFERLDI